MTAWEEAEAYGIDMSLLEHSLGLSLEERVLYNQVALEFMLECERAGREYYAERAMGLLHRVSLRGAKRRSNPVLST